MGLQFGIPIPTVIYTSVMNSRGRPSKYNREQVQLLVSQAKNWYELALALGMGWVSTAVTQPQVRLIVHWKFGIDTSHFDRKRRGVDYPPVPKPVQQVPTKTARPHPPSISKEDLEKELLSGKSLRDIAKTCGMTVRSVGRYLRRYGLPKPTPIQSIPSRESVQAVLLSCRDWYELSCALGYGRVKRTLDKLLERYGLDGSHLKKRKKYSSSRQKYKERGLFRTGKWTTWLVQHPDPGCPGHSKRPTSGDRLLFALLLSGRPYQCGDCGTPSTWNGKELRLQVDHTNGKTWDNRSENLKILCPNCHAQTDTFCGRNLRSRPDAEQKSKYRRDRIRRILEIVRGRT